MLVEQIRKVSVDLRRSMKLPEVYEDLLRMSLRQLGHDYEPERALTTADRVFSTTHVEDAKDAAALSGRGSIALLRDDYREALQYIDQTLGINTSCRAAKRATSTSGR